MEMPNQVFRSKPFLFCFVFDISKDPIIELYLQIFIFCEIFFTIMQLEVVIGIFLSEL